MENQMLCYQCGIAKNGKCCNDTVGACGKSAETSRLQDELTGALVGLAKASVNKSIDENIQRLVVDGLAATAAHTNFDDAYLANLTEQVKAAKTKFVPKFGSHNASLKLPDDFDIRVIWQKSPDIRSLKSILLFGIRGIALYAAESWALGTKNREAASYFHKALIALGANHFKEDYYDLLNEMGGVALRAMEQANKARTSVYGQPAPVEVPRTIEPGPFIIVSGHNFEVLAQILEQTKESGINIYSHGEMLPAHAYPEFRKYRHFKGHYGTAWQNQQDEFDCIPAAIVFTSGCMSVPLPSYMDRVFTAGNAHLQGIPHLDKDFTPVMIRSIEMGGAPEQIAFPGINGGNMIRTGFGKKSLRTISYKLAAALKEDSLKHIYVIGGCDGKEANRQEYTNMIRNLPTDAVVLTWGCAKYRFNDIDFGAIDGVPRIIDLGMCGDLSLVIETVEAIAESAKLRVDELPLTWHYSWQEERSVSQIFALFAADVQKVILGPTLPPFFTQEVFRVVAKDYNMTLMESETPADTEDYVPVFAAAKAEEEEAKKEAEAAVEIPTPVGGAQQVSYTPQELEDRSEAAGLPAWAMVDDDDDEEEETPVPAVKAEPVAPKVRPEDLDQSPVWLSNDDDDDDDIIAIPEEAPMDIEARSQAAGLPAWAMEDDDEEDEIIVTSYEEDIPAPVGERTASFAEILALREEKGDTEEEEEIIEETEVTEEIVETPSAAPVAAEPIKKEIVIEDTPVNYTMNQDAPKVVIPKGKGVSGWKDPDDEPSFTPGARKPYVYTPPKELVEIPQPAPIALPEGAGISGYAASHDGDTSTDSVIKNNSGGGLYSFAEAQPEIKIPKGKGVSGWKESDDEIKPIKKSSSDDEGSNAKPWLKQSLEKLHAEVEEANAPATPIPPAVPAEPAPAPVAQGQTVAEEPAPAPIVEEPAVEEHSDKPWLAASIKQLKESIAADEAAEANKNSDKPWLAASLNALHAEVEAEKNGGTPAASAPQSEENADEEAYVSKYKHDPNAAADKPWLKSSIEELKNSIDAEAGIKSVRAEKKTQSQAISAEEASSQWQETAAPKSWKNITPAAQGNTTAAVPAAAPVAAESAATTNNEVTDEPSGGGEPDALWQKPARTPKPWDQNLTTTWRKPEVMPKPWENPNATSYHTSADDRGVPKEQVIPNIPLGNPLMQQQRLAEQQAQQAALEAQQRAIVEQQVHQAAMEVQQRALAEQQAQQAAYEAQQRAIAEQQAQQAAYEAQQRAIAEQQAQQAAYEAQQRAIAEQQAQQAAYEAQQRALAEQQAQQQAQWQAQQQALAQQQAEVRRLQQAALEAEQRANAARQSLEQQAEQIRNAQQAQQAYAARLQEQNRQIESARAAQEQQAAQLEQQAQQLRQLQQQQQRQMNQQSMRNRQEQQAYAAQLEQQAQQLRAAQEQQAAYRAQLDQEAAQMRAAQQAQAQQQQQLAQQEQMLRQTMAQQQAAQNPYQFGNGQGNEGPMMIPQGGGVSGYRSTPGFIPGQERPQVNFNETIQQPMTNAPQHNANIPANGGISGSRYHEALPPIQTDYSATYGVPQPQIVPMPQGVGVSGWSDPNPVSVSQARPAHTNFFGFMNSDAPAGVRSNTEVINTSGDEYIATKGPDGEVTVTIRSDK